MQSFFSSSVVFKQNYIIIFGMNFEPKSEVGSQSLRAGRKILGLLADGG
jgi:hypothetical protein